MLLEVGIERLRLFNALSLHPVLLNERVGAAQQICRDRLHLRLWPCHQDHLPRPKSAGKPEILERAWTSIWALWRDQAKLVQIEPEVSF